MTNPWSELSTNTPYLLGDDKERVQAFASRQKSDAQLQLDSIPEPFIGNPETARIVLLLLNPGHDIRDTEAHRNVELKAAMFRNLRGEHQRYPFYPLNPDFSWTPTAKWWIPRTRKLKEATGLTYEALSERLLAIEWFPYHSKSSGLPSSKVCESQEYSFALAKKVLGNTFILRMRSSKHWEKVDSRFGDIPALKNPRISYISPRNTDPGIFDEIVRILK
jgi:hypothetical protein